MGSCKRSFVINNLSGQNTQVKAHIPRRLLSGMYGIMNPNDVKSAIINKDGNLTYLSHQFIPYKGFEPKHNEAFYPNHDDSEYLLDDDEFGMQEEFPEDTQKPLTDNNPGNESDLDDDIEASKFDFDGDGKANSYLEVSMSLPTDMIGPLEVQVGDPFVDPFANLDESLFGSISGNVSDSEGNPLENFDVWFFKVPEPGKDLHSGEPAFFNLERGENGSFVASLPAGSYHAEAFAYDPDTDTPYKPEIAGGIASPTTFTIEGSDTSITEINFSLEEEFRMSHEFASIEGEVIVAGRDEVDHVFFDLFPVKDGVRQTDYPIFSFGLERGGKIRGEAPVGTFEVEVFSPDNSLYLQAPLNLNVTAGETNSIGTVELIQREMVTVRGSIKDSSNNPIWAEVVFVDPNDDDNRFWPMPLEIGLSEGEFAVKVPEGNYKILAERFDGMYKSAFYDADDNDVADTVSITSNKTGIDFVLESRPTATVTIKLLDANTSEPVKYAWFDFFDAEDEYAPIVFPHLGMIDFESDTFDGTYTLSVLGGEYKLAVGAHNYEGIFRVIDEAGNATWSAGSWENGVAITLTDGETTVLGDVNMTSFGKSEAELFGFDWLDEGEELTGGSTITGTVKTSSGIAVPKARIIAHTEDYLFWFDHARSRSDGSFELKISPMVNG